MLMQVSQRSGRGSQPPSHLRYDSAAEECYVSFRDLWQRQKLQNPGPAALPKPPLLGGMGLAPRRPCALSAFGILGHLRSRPVTFFRPEARDNCSRLWARELNVLRFCRLSVVEPLPLIPTQMGKSPHWSLSRADSGKRRQCISLSERLRGMARPGPEALADVLLTGHLA